MSFLKRSFRPLPLLLVKRCYENNTRNLLLILSVTSGYTSSAHLAGQTAKEPEEMRDGQGICTGKGEEETEGKAGTCEEGKIW